MLGIGRYNYPRFTRAMLDDHETREFAGPKPGELAPEFTAYSLDGQSIRLRNFRGLRPVLLVFGSATCPMTAHSVAGISALYEEFHPRGVEFVMVYVREAHPGEKIPAHGSSKQKSQAARLLRDAENISLPIVPDSLSGTIHEKYGSLPNAAFLIDLSGRVAFRSKWANRAELQAALEELLHLQSEHGKSHAVVHGGQDLSMPLTYRTVHVVRALQRGGHQALLDFRNAVNLSTGGMSRRTDRAGYVLATAALTAMVLAGGLYAGFELRRRRFSVRANPYRAYEKELVQDTETGTEYGAVGI